MAKGLAKRDLLTCHCRVGEEASWFLKTECAAAFPGVNTGVGDGFSSTREKPLMIVQVSKLMWFGPKPCNQRAVTL